LANFLLKKKESGWAGILKLGKKCCSGTGDICIFARIKIPSPISVFLEKPRCHSAITTKNTPQQTRRGQTMTA
jgi:hypothetical protein